MPKFSRPCLKCGAVTNRGDTYCPTHLAQVRQAQEQKRTQDPKRKLKKKLLYNSDYRKAREALVANVRQYGAECYLCNRPIAPTDPIDADHLFAGIPGSPLRPTHSNCNRSRGNRSSH